MATSEALAIVAKGDLCAGCGGCAGMFPDAIAIRTKAPGFLRPVQVGALPVGADDAIADICPGLGQRVAPGGRRDDPLWGPWRSAWTGWSMDGGERHRGASGGALTALLTHLLRAGVVQAVVQNAPDPKAPLANRTVLTDDPAAFSATAGSRYAPSAPLEALPDILADGRRVAFVGKPCDAAALAAIRARDPAVARAVPVIVSFFCAGVPSATGAREILRQLRVEETEVARFRYRGHGWPGRATAVLHDGTERSMTYRESWGGILSKHVQHRCKICADGTGKAADLVCADAWEVDDSGYPRFDERPGESLVLARTVLGEQIARGAQAAGRLALRPYDMARLADIQPGQRERRRALSARLAALRLLRQPIPDYRGLGLRRAARQNPWRRNLRNFLGTLRRHLRR
nr:Coenzyme F420 hydrogenase/dehydrogenase, beta subunit C-terminal domain [Jannaschia sp. S6380]